VPLSHSLPEEVIVRGLDELYTQVYVFDVENVLNNELNLYLSIGIILEIAINFIIEVHFSVEG
jgi:hypothetical protein